jgi:hypothetical protein
MTDAERQELRAKLRRIIAGMDVVALLDMCIPQNSIRAKIAAWLRPHIRVKGWHTVIKDGKLKAGPVRRAYLKWYHDTRTEELKRTNAKITYEQITTLAIEQSNEVLGHNHFGRYLRA